MKCIDVPAENPILNKHKTYTDVLTHTSEIFSSNLMFSKSCCLNKWLTRLQFLLPEVRRAHYGKEKVSCIKARQKIDFDITGSAIRKPFKTCDRKREKLGTCCSNVQKNWINTSVVFVRSRRQSYTINIIPASLSYSRITISGPPEVLELRPYFLLPIFWLS